MKEITRNAPLGPMFIQMCRRAMNGPLIFTLIHIIKGDYRVCNRDFSITPHLPFGEASFFKLWPMCAPQR